MRLGEGIVERDGRLINGFGLNIGSPLIEGALLKLYEKGHHGIERNLMLRPFPRNLPPRVREARVKSQVSGGHDRPLRLRDFHQRHQPHA